MLWRKKEGGAAEVGLQEESSIEADGVDIVLHLACH